MGFHKRIIKSAKKALNIESDITRRAIGTASPSAKEDIDKANIKGSGQVSRVTKDVGTVLSGDTAPLKSKEASRKIKKETLLSAILDEKAAASLRRKTERSIRQSTNAIRSLGRRRRSIARSRGTLGEAAGQAKTLLGG